MSRSRRAALTISIVLASLIWASTAAKPLTPRIPAPRTHQTLPVRRNVPHAQMLLILGESVRSSVATVTRILTLAPTAPSRALTAATSDRLTQQGVLALLTQYKDWDSRLMARYAWCESRFYTDKVNPTALWQGGRLVHSTGLLGVLGGSTVARTNVAQAHSLFLASLHSKYHNGYRPWPYVPDCGA